MVNAAVPQSYHLSLLSLELVLIAVHVVRVHAAGVAMRQDHVGLALVLGRLHMLSLLANQDVVIALHSLPIADT